MEDILEYDGCINTFSGLKFSFIDPKADQINILDIAKGLANKGHFGGQTEKFFSIAQHSVLVFNLLSSRDKNKCLAALLHDASEAYTGDIVKPLKLLLPNFKEIEDNITKVIFEKFEIDISLLKEIKPFDIEAQNIEYKNFFKGENTLIYLSPVLSFEEFMNKFNEVYLCK